MPRRVNVAWGWSGMVRVPGFGQTNEQLRRPGIEPGLRSRGERGCLFDGTEFAKLVAHLRFDDISLLETTVRPRLDFIREFTIKALLYADQKPKPVSVHGALELMIYRVVSFLAAVERLDRLTFENLRLEKTSTVDRPTAFHVFISLPGRLHDVAAAARQAARLESEAALLVTLSDSAQRLAEVLHFLDGESQNVVLRNLQWTGEYHVRSIAEIVLVTRRTLLAARTALQKGKRLGAPKRITDLDQTVAWLTELYEACGRRFTHTPRKPGVDDGAPYSAAGLFVFAFLKACAPGVTPQQTSTLMARFIATRSRRRQTPRETSI